MMTRSSPEDAICPNYVRSCVLSLSLLLLLLFLWRHLQ
jgi:hypothetical protein